MKTQSNILVIDDEKIVCDSFKSILSREGYHVETRMSPEEGLDQAVSQKYNLVFLDLRMEKMDGIELFHKIREKSPELPVVIVTGYPSLDTALECIKLRAADYIIKPFTPDDILKLTRQIIPEISPLKKEARGKLARKAVYTKWEPSGKPVSFLETAWMKEGIDGTVRVGVHLPCFIANNISEMVPAKINELVYQGLPLTGIQLTYDFKVMVPSPVTGRVIDVNHRIFRDPSLLAKTSFEDGWIARLEPSDISVERPKTQVREVVLLTRWPDKLKQFIDRIHEKGCTVQIAETPEEATSILTKKDFKVLFIHAESISQKGPGLVDLINEEYPGTKVVVLGHVGMEEEKAFRSTRILYYHPSPFFTEEVNDIVYSIFTSFPSIARMPGAKYHGVLPSQISRVHITNKHGKKATLLIFGDLLQYNNGIGAILIEKLLEQAYPIEVTRGKSHIFPDTPDYCKKITLEKEQSDVIITLQAREISRIPGHILREVEHFDKNGIADGRMIKLVIQPNNHIRKPLAFSNTTSRSVAEWLFKWMTTPDA